VEPHPVQGLLRRAAQVGDERGGVRVPGRHRVLVRDVSGGHHVDGIHLDDAGGRPLPAGRGGPAPASIDETSR
jgi:hypothetical protein